MQAAIIVGVLRKGSTASKKLLCTDSPAQPVAAMQAVVPAIAMHHKALRGLLGKYRGAEVYAEADALLMSFQDPADAVAWCLATQQVGST